MTSARVTKPQVLELLALKNLFSFFLFFLLVYGDVEESY